MRRTEQTITNAELQKKLQQFPDEATINIHVDAETSELRLEEVWIEYITEGNFILITMGARNP